jgi:hypothetical protein
MQLVTNVLPEDEGNFKKYFLAAVPVPEGEDEAAWIASYGPKAYNAAVKKGKALLLSKKLKDEKDLAY